MTTGRPICLVALTVWLTVLFTVPAAGQITIEPVGTYATGQFDDSAAEICAYDPQTQRVFVSNAGDQRVDILDVRDPTNPVLWGTVEFDNDPLAADDDEPTAVDFKDGLGAVAIKRDEVTDPGFVAFFDADGIVLSSVAVGSLPDSVTFTPDGKKVLVPNEGEPNDDYTVDPEGSISIIDVSRGGGDVTQDDVRTADFRRFNSQKKLLRAVGVRIYGPTVNEVIGDDGEVEFEVIDGGASVAQDVEPEYVGVSHDSRTAWVTLQENNALAVVDIRRARVTRILPLGSKLHILRRNSLDASDRDDAIDITREPARGLYQPDWVKTYRVGGQTFLVLANEGDARDYDGFSEEERVKDLTLGGFLARIPDLQEDENLGRLRCTNRPPRGRVPGAGPDGEDVFRQIYSFGARSFSIRRTNGSLVFDSGDQLEQITADFLPEHFNSNDDASPSFEARSDDKGPEPEAVALGRIHGRTYAFIGSERIGGIFIYDISRPHRPHFVDYVNNRDFSVEFDIGDCEDCEDDCTDDCVEDCEDCKTACDECANCPEGEDCTEACEACEACEEQFGDCEDCESCDAVTACAEECTAECEAENCPLTGVEGRDPLDLGPEGVLFISAGDSPDGFGPLLVVTNEISGTTTIFEVLRTGDGEDGEPGDGDDDD